MGIDIFVTDRLRPAGLTQGPDEIEMMRIWLADCVENHRQCKARWQLGPARVLDLCAFADSDDLRLVDCPSDPSAPHAPFFCLSHCWGEQNAAPLRTTKGTLSRHKQVIHLESLSNTFRDAVKITRQLEQRYLWIDSLCIIQDDPADWEAQASRMPSVYGASILTLSALSAKDGDGGCRTLGLTSASNTGVKYVDVDVGGQRIRFFDKPPEFWFSEYGDDPYKHDGFGPNPLRQRAWTLQERELPVRSVHFSKNMLLWQCQTLKASSQLPCGTFARPDDIEPSLILACEDLGAAVDAWKLRARWFDIVEDYTSRLLTREEDKLPALAGLAASYAPQEIINRYLAGLWETQLPSALLWRVLSPYNDADRVLGDRRRAFFPRRPTRYRAPSWSWASIDGAVSYDSQRRSSSCSPQYGRRDDFAQIASLRIRAVHTSLAGSSAHGKVSEGRLHVEGRVAVLTCEDSRLAPKKESIDGHVYWSLKTADESPVGVIYPDVPLELSFRQVVHCLQIHDEPAIPELDRVSHSECYGYKNLDVDWRLASCMGIALTPLRERENMFRRIGLCRWVKKEVFDAVVAGHLTIV